MESLQPADVSAAGFTRPAVFGKIGFTATGLSRLHRELAELSRHTVPIFQIFSRISPQFCDHSPPVFSYSLQLTPALPQATYFYKSQLVSLQPLLFYLRFTRSLLISCPYQIVVSDS